MRVLLVMFIALVFISCAKNPEKKKTVTHQTSYENERNKNLRFRGNINANQPAQPGQPGQPGQPQPGQPNLNPNGPVPLNNAPKKTESIAYVCNFKEVSGEKERLYFEKGGYLADNSWGLFLGNLFSGKLEIGKTLAMKNADPDQTDRNQTICANVIATSDSEFDITLNELIASPLKTDCSNFQTKDIKFSERRSVHAGEGVAYEYQGKNKNYKFRYVVMVSAPRENDYIERQNHYCENFHFDSKVTVINEIQVPSPSTPVPTPVPSPNNPAPSSPDDFTDNDGPTQPSDHALD